ANTYQEIGEFWDNHDATEFGEQAEAEFEINIQAQRRYYPIDRQLALKIRQLADERGVSEETLLNLWIQEKINHIETKREA
ncbi:MAG: BrnA antitoxin family protein, partial [Pseudomonadota bacterium]|nr:BrnA antitoxin family protein [Pseudomonadota bacterium]